MTDIKQADAKVQAAIELLLDYLVYCEFENFCDDARDRGCVWRAVRIAGEWLGQDFTEVDKVIHKVLDEGEYPADGPQSPMQLSPEEAQLDLGMRSGWRGLWGERAGTLLKSP